MNMRKEKRKFVAAIGIKPGTSVFSANALPTAQCDPPKTGFKEEYVDTKELGQRL